MLQPRTPRTFDKYLSTVYAPYILKKPGTPFLKPCMLKYC